MSTHWSFALRRKKDMKRQDADTNKFKDNRLFFVFLLSARWWESYLCDWQVIGRCGENRREVVGYCSSLLIGLLQHQVVPKER